MPVLIPSKQVQTCFNFLLVQALNNSTSCIILGQDMELLSLYFGPTYVVVLSGLGVAIGNVSTRTTF